MRTTGLVMLGRASGVVLSIEGAILFNGFYHSLVHIITGLRYALLRQGVRGVLLAICDMKAPLGPSFTTAALNCMGFPCSFEFEEAL